MGKYQFVSPGAAAGAGILELLTQRREEERQRILDEITAKNAESQRAAQEQQIRASQEAVEASRGQRERETLKASLPGRELGEDLGSLPPELKELYKKYGMAGAKPKGITPAVGAEETFLDHPPTEEELDAMAKGAATPAAPPEEPGLYFSGTPQDRKTERIKQAVGNFRPGSAMEGLNRQDIPHWQRVIQAAGMFEQDIPGTAFTSMQPEKPRMFINPVTGQATPILGPDKKPITAGPGDESIIRGEQPRQEYPQSFQMVGTDPDTGKGIYLNQRTGKESVGGFRVGPRPGTARQAATVKEQDLVPVGTSQKLGDLRGLADRSDQDNARYFETATNIIMSARVADPSVRDAALRVLNGVHPLTNQPLTDETAREIGYEMSQTEGATPQEVDQLVRLIYIARGF
jgi:hypothetical protein